MGANCWLLSSFPIFIVMTAFFIFHQVQQCDTQKKKTKSSTIAIYQCRLLYVVDNLLLNSVTCGSDQHRKETHGPCDTVVNISYSTNALLRIVKHIIHQNLIFVRYRKRFPRNTYMT